MKKLALIMLALSPLVAGASTRSALKDYQNGRYDEALKDYERLMEGKGEDPRLRFNAGAAAYRGQQLEEAAKQFEQALNSPDLKLQERAYYNRGNTRYYLGEQNPDPAKRMQSWSNALQDFESSMKLDPGDPDAKWNHDFVKKRIEELQQQQQKSDQNKDKQDNKDDKDQQKQDQQKQDQGKQDQQKQDQQKQDKPSQDQQKQGQQQSDQQKQDQQDKGRQQPQEQQPPDQQKQGQQPKPDPQKQDQQKQAEAQQAKPEDKQPDPSEEEKQEAAAAAAGQMTPKQATQLLDAQKGNEMVMPPKRQKPAERARRLRDW